jgi:hypothetical protein
MSDTASEQSSQIAVPRSDWLRRKLPTLLRRGLALYDFLIFLLVVVAVVLVTIYLAAPDTIFLLKVLAIVYFSLLPALLYLQFSSGRTLAVWRDYVCNLYKLRADTPAALPRPPTLSPFHSDWLAERERAWNEGRVKPEHEGETRKDVDEKLEQANQYRVKFQDLFGDVPLLEQPKNWFSLRSAHKLQVVMATVLMTIGWTFVVQPESLFDRSFTSSKFHLAGLPAIPRETFAFAFLGTYFYILQMLVRRYFQNDLKATAYINATMRIVIVVLLVWVIDPLLHDHTSQAMRSAVAFVVGVFPAVGWQFLQQIVVRKPLGLIVDSLEPKHKLGDLDGLNIWYESRLLEVGIEDIQNLTTTDIVDLMLNTRIPVDRIIDWIDQAFLYLRVVDQPSRDLLRGFGIRTATDLDDALAGDTESPPLDRLLNFVPPPQGRNDDGLPSRMRAIRASIETERNMQHVRAWKSYTVGEKPATQPEAEPPPAPVPVPA